MSSIMIRLTKIKFKSVTLKKQSCWFNQKKVSNIFSEFFLCDYELPLLPN